MEVVSATKMRKAQEAAINSRMYAIQALALMGKVAPNVPHGVSPLLARDREVKTTLIVVVTSDRGLAGSFNSQVFRGDRCAPREDDSILQSLITNSRLWLSAKSNPLCLKTKRGIGAIVYGFGGLCKSREIAPLQTSLWKGFLLAAGIA